jgi:hypothetical protein
MRAIWYLIYTTPRKPSLEPDLALRVALKLINSILFLSRKNITLNITNQTFTRKIKAPDGIVATSSVLQIIPITKNLQPVTRQIQNTIQLTEKFLAQEKRS